MKQQYAVVSWCELYESYSCVKVSKIIYDKNLLLDPNELIGNTYKVEYNGQEYEGTVVEVGSRAKMSKLTAEKSAELGDKSLEDKEETGNKLNLRKRNHDALQNKVTIHIKKKKRLTTKEGIVNRNSNEVISSMTKSQEPDNSMLTSTGSFNNLNLNTSNNELAPDVVSNSLNPGINLLSQSFIDNLGEPMNGDLCLENVVEDQHEDFSLDKNKIIEDLKRKLSNEKKKTRRLQRTVDKNYSHNEPQDGEEVEEETIDIGSDIKVNRSVVNDIKSDYRRQPGIFLRKLMFKTGIFTIQEVSECSLTGQKHSDGSQRPSLNSEKFLACKNFTIKKCKIKENSVQMFQFRQSMSNICTDARKSLKNKSRRRLEADELVLS